MRSAAHNELRRWPRILKPTERVCGNSSRNGRRLLVAVPYFPPDPKAGGAEMFTVALVKGLSAIYGWDVTIVTTMPQNLIVEEVVPANIKIYRLPYKFMLSNSPMSISWYKHLKRIISDVDPDVINIHLPVPGLGDLVSYLSGNIPVAIYYHFGSMKKGSLILDSIIGVYESIILPFTLRQAKRLACGTTYVKNGILQGFSDKTCIIPPGVDFTRFRPAPQRLTLPHVLYVGSLNRSDQHKRFSDLLEACAFLREDVPGFRLTAVGGGDSRRFYENLAVKLGISDVVEFRGRLEGDALAEAYRNAAVLVVPSLRETFGMVLTEGMASGLPVVAVDGGGVRALVEDNKNGLLVAPRSPQALANALRSILTDPERGDAFGEAGRRMVTELFGWGQQIAAMNSLLVDVAGSGSRDD